MRDPERTERALDGFTIVLVLCVVSFIFVYMICAAIAAAIPGGMEAWRIGLIGSIIAVGVVGLVGGAVATIYALDG